MAFEAFQDFGSGLQSSGSGLQSITGALGDIFGSSSSQSVKGSGTVKGTTGTKGRATEQLQIEQAGVEKLLQDVLGSVEGLAPIFSEEQVAGIFGGSVAAQASGDLLAKLTGEIAKLTAKKVTTKEEEAEIDQSTTSRQKQKSGSGGLIKQIFG